MAELIFTKTTINDKEAYVAELRATNAVNVHFERSEHGTVVFKLCVPESGDWATARKFSAGSAPLVFDENLISDIYPISWRIESFSPILTSILTAL